MSGNIAMQEGATRADTLTMVRELQRAVADTAKEYEEKYGPGAKAAIMPDRQGFFALALAAGLCDGTAHAQCPASACLRAERA